MGMQYVAAIMIPQFYFDKKRAIATGITVGGAPVGGMIFAPLVQFFINTYGWRSTMLLMGAIVLHGCAMGILMIPPCKLKKAPSFPDVKDLEPPEPRPLSRLKVDMGSVLLQSIENMKSAISLEMPDSETDTKCRKYAKKLSRMFDISALKQVIVLVVLANFLLFNMGYMVPYVFLPMYTSQYGIDPTTTANILSVSGGADFFGRISLGVLGNCECLNSIHLFGGCTMLSGLSCILSLLADNTPAFYVFGFVFGFSVGTFVAFFFNVDFDFISMALSEKANCQMWILFLRKGVSHNRSVISKRFACKFVCISVQAPCEEIMIGLYMNLRQKGIRISVP